MDLPVLDISYKCDYTVCVILDYFISIMSSWFIPVSQFPSFAGRWWLTPVILATQEAEIRRILVWNQPRQIVQETLSQKKLITKKRGRGGWWSGSGCRP
jgi:hypothetical protein